MDIHNPDVWLSHLLEALPEEKLASKLSDENLQWEYIDGEIVKLGSLNHAQLDVPELQRQGLQLLASESKDFRLVSHLLRTLQHAGNPLLALSVLTQYVTHYWTIAWPQSAANKKRFADQILKRFEPGMGGFAATSTPEQRDTLLGELAKLAQCWQACGMPELASSTDDLFAQYQRAFRDSSPVAAPPVLPTVGATLPEVVPVTAAPAPVVNIDSHDDKAWRDTQLKVAGILCERQPASPQGYRLRRHALWQNITSAPQAESDGRTPLAAVSADMVADYQARLTRADMTLWQQVEQSLLLAPYWLDGHHLSAQIAQQLGHDAVAQAIRDEARHFLARLPQLDALRFNDRSHFINEATRQWLADEPQKPVAVAIATDDMTQQVWLCWQEQGLEAALVLAERLPGDTPRAQFYRQYLTAQLQEAAGMTQLAQYHYRMLFKTGLHTMLSDWEPALLEQLETKLATETASE
ncbi:type VI secretion system protein TssA [Salmonella enterica]|uniref:type VI secretion system protein TssA n=1 Tax=Salmonella enterica TaxID=28901 RepID=UPI00107A0415|nr:type VI secretion system protein TssA [Salmonella enterica subsp. enterica serovar Idikan]EAB2791455.1 type VI secretion system protein TssA [Salmonella enterica]ECD8570860.1 type VI secretion system protein TssA [Salmonella enterica subsp. enterica]ECO1428451.1 type VI secretion system protein TssA [Salmonella enterica subsp. enterica serovar Senftenberg]EEM8291731.1 type VI secretion system protein TssA [Salmonella enterica subsp. enterica serovar Infantis]EHG4736263.1 type VI secretion s